MLQILDYSMKVQDIMYDRDQLFTIDQEVTVREAAQFMTEKKIGALLLEKDDVIVGIVTTGDFMRKVIAEGKNPDKIQAKDIMSSPLIMINYNAGIVEAAELMAKYKIKRLVAVDEGEVTGIVSNSLIGKNIGKLVKR